MGTFAGCDGVDVVLATSLDGCCDLCDAAALADPNACRNLNALGTLLAAVDGVIASGSADVGVDGWRPLKRLPMVVAEGLCDVDGGNSATVDVRLTTMDGIGT